MVSKEFLQTIQHILNKLFEKNNKRKTIFEKKETWAIT